MPVWSAGRIKNYLPMETEKNFQNQNQLDGIDRNAWMTVTKQMYYGVLIYSICGVLANVVGPVNAVSSGISMISGNGGGGGGVFNILISLAIIAGYVMFFLGLKDFRNVVNIQDRDAVQKLFTATIISIVGYVLGLIPVIGWLLKGICVIVSCIMMLIGYSSLRKSQSFPGLACDGASKLYTAMILSIIGAVIGFIPLVGGVIGGILDIIAFVMIIIGWKRIAFVY